jgi:hypothetical protein
MFGIMEPVEKTDAWDEIEKLLQEEKENPEEYLELLPRPPQYIGGKPRNTAPTISRRPCIRSKLHSRRKAI